MYKVKPIVENNTEDIFHTDRMYKCNSPKDVCASTTSKDAHPELNKFIVNKSSARSELGRSLQDQKQPMASKKEKCNSSGTIFTTNPQQSVNEMLLDRYIVRKTAPASKLGRHLHSQDKPDSSAPENAELLCRLEELDGQLNSLLGSMRLNKTATKPIKKENVQLPEREDMKPIDLKPATANRQVTSVLSKIVDGVVTASNTLTSIDLAIHCDPSSPPFAVLLYSKLLLMAGRNVSVQFYRHSSLKSQTKHLAELERYFAGRPRSADCEMILSIIWRPCSFGCVAISNPFTELPTYGESIALMLLSRLAPHFSKCFEHISQIDSAFRSGNEKKLDECIKKVAGAPNSTHSIPEMLLFVSCVQKGRLSLLQKAARPWFEKCMTSEHFCAIKDLIELFS